MADNSGRQRIGKRRLMVAAVTLLCIGAVAVACLAWWRHELARQAARSGDQRVIVIGASISQAWHIEQLPERLPIPGFSFEAMQAWQFDKSALLAETLMRPARKPRLTRTYLLGFIRPPPRPADVIVLKECSAYFPGDAAQNQQHVRRWVDELRARQIDVMLATVVPITAVRAAREAGKQAAVEAFNDWLRQYASAEGIPLLDLEQATRISELDRHLRQEFDVGDGAHLNRAAYVVLDGMMAEKVKTLTASAVGSAP